MLLADQNSNPIREDTLNTRKNSNANVKMLKSLALPGWGEHSLNYNTRGYIFNTTELLGWLSYAAFTFYGRKTRKDMKTYASENAQISISGKDKQYYADIGDYNTIYEYNDQMRRKGLIQSVYSVEENYWYWNNAGSREKFDKLRYKSNLALRNASLATTALLINRIISVIDVLFITEEGKKKKNTLQSHNFYADFTSGVNFQKISLNLRF